MRVLEGLLTGLKAVCSGFTDKRRGKEVTYTMADIGLSAFSLFFMQSESFLSYQRRLREGHGTSNCQTLFGMEKIPTDNHIRSMLDEVDPAQLQPSFDEMQDALQKHGGLKAFQRLGERTLIALDGTEYFCSQKLGCPHCLTRRRNNGKVESYHTMLAATIVAPAHNLAVPLMPEFIAPRDGAEKQDCERNAAKRWLATHSKRVAGLHPVYLGDALFACQPLAEAVLQTGADFLFVCKPDGHKTLYDFIQGSTLEEHVVTQTHPGKKRLTYRYRWIESVPLRDGKDALLVHWIAVTITDAKGKATYDGAFVTSLPVSKDNVAELVACARARWKIENESFNVLKNNGYHLEHNFGHGKRNLTMMFAAMNLLAFAFHTVCDCLEGLWRKAREIKRARVRFFEHIRTLSAYLVFPSWKILMETLISSKPPPKLQKMITL
jgi:Transposase DDE domain